MIIETIPVLGDNYSYLLVCETSGEAAVIDPADAEAVLLRVTALGVRLSAIFNTHHHLDHTAGNQELLKRFPLKVYGHPDDRSRIAGMTDSVNEGDEIPLGRLRVRIRHTPGHTLGALCFLVEDALFTGDTLFAAGCGRLFEGTAEMMHQSLEHAIRSLSPDTRIYCGHEYTEKNLKFARTVDPENEALVRRLDQATAARRHGRPTVPLRLVEELETNPFLRCESEAIYQTLRRRESRLVFSPLQIFTRLRLLRDSF